MDSRGWIPIALIASFNRVRQLTTDAHLVRDVLILSTVVEVRDDWVRMRGWDQFVLPDAERSIVEEFEYEHYEVQYHPHEDKRGVHHVHGGAEGDAEEGDASEEEDEDVVFVMGRAAEPWSPKP